MRYYEMDDLGSGLLADMNSFSDRGVLITPQNKWRAKLYQLNNQGSWDDFGTGEFSIVKDVSSDF